ncbi:MAG: rRNA pseudouridylate synthase [Proteobacteria bacterium]|nr:rRNA pseudouridylate synthase [Pseudomonadota bacterium]
MKSAPRARRPQPEIREQKTARNDAASLRAGKPAPNTRRGKPVEAAAGQSRAPYEAAKPAGQAPKARFKKRDPLDEWQTRPPSGAARGAQAAKPAAATPAAGQPVDAKKRQAKRRDDAPATRAKRLRVRAGSQKEVAIQRQLRDKRLPADQLNAERLQKALAFTGYGSRRDMEEAIEAGRVSVNGKIASLGDKVNMGDEVRFDGKRVNIKWPDRLPRIVIYHKQEGELVSRDDPEGRTTVFERLPRLDNSKWIAIGRLDFNTSGLLIFTTSGDLANKMMHPRFEVEREYAVRVIGELTDEQKKELTKGIELDDGPAHFSRMVDGGGEGSNHWYHVIIKEGRNREVRRMFEYFGLTVSRLMRVRFGAVTLPPRLKRGQFYELNETEVLGIVKWAGLRMNGQEKNF